METLTHAVGTLAFLIALLGAVPLLTTLTKGRRLPPHGLLMPALAIEFARDVAGVEALFTQPDGGRALREQIRKGLYGDYVFIAMYWLLLNGLSVLLAMRGGRLALIAAVVAAVSATATAIFDVVENLSLAALLDAQSIEPHLVRNVAAAGLGKWLLISVSILALSPLFFLSGWLVPLGALNVLCAAGFTYGVLRSPRVVELAFLLNFIGTLATGIIFSFWRADAIF